MQNFAGSAVFDRLNSCFTGEPSRFRAVSPLLSCVESGAIENAAGNLPGSIVAPTHPIEATVPATGAAMSTCVPEGDVAVLLQQASGPARWLGVAFERTDKSLRKWPVAAAMLLAIATVLAETGILAR